MISAVVFHIIGLTKFQDCVYRDSILLYRFYEQKEHGMESERKVEWGMEGAWDGRMEGA